MKYLSSNQLKGRLTGTKENQETEQYINEWFEKIGLNKYNGDIYFMPYNHLFYDFSSQNIEMSVKFSDGTTKNCVLGKDFYPQNLISNVNLSCPITFDINDENLKNTIVVLQNHIEKISKNNKVSKGTKRKYNKILFELCIAPYFIPKNLILTIWKVPYYYLMKKSEK